MVSSSSSSSSSSAFPSSSSSSSLRSLLIMDEVFPEFRPCRIPPRTLQMDNDVEYLLPVLNTASQPYGKVSTIWVTVSYILLTVVLEIIAIIVYFNWSPNAVQCGLLYLFLYGHAALWITTVIFDHYLKISHHSLYLHGYLEFTEYLKRISGYALHIVSLWNVFLLVVLAWYHQRNVELEKACRLTSVENPVLSVLGLISVEACLLVAVLTNYLYKVHHFNNDRRLPDVEIASDWAPINTFVSDELGLKESMNGVEDLLRKQADRIRFYKNESEALKKKILTLSSAFHSESIN